MLPTTFHRTARYLSLLAFLAGCGGGPDGSTAIALDSSAHTLLLGPRDVVTVEVRSVTAGVAITGSLDPASVVEVKSQLAGQVGQVLVDRGSAVRRRQVLAVYDDQTSRAQAASAAARLAAAERDLSASDTLYKAGAVSERDYVNAKAARGAAQAQVAQAEETLSRTSVRAPIAGTVSERNVSEGEAVRVGDLLFTVVNSDALELTAQVGADEIGRVAVGQVARIRLDALPDQELEGRVARIEPVANSGTRQVGVYIRVPNRDRRLVGGLFASGRIITSTGKNAAALVPAVPIDAVREANGQSVLYVVDSGRIAVRIVKLGARDASAGLVEVREGIAAGATVIANPTSELAPGTLVRLARDSAGLDGGKGQLGGAR